MSGWRVLVPTCVRWTTEDPSDPDLVLEYALHQGDRLRVSAHPLVRIGQRIRQCPPQLRLSSPGDHWQLEVTLGMTTVYRLCGNRLDRWLAGLVRVEVARGESTGCIADEASIRMEAHTPLELRVPGASLDLEWESDMPLERDDLH